MATQKVVVEGSSNVTASQLKDFFRQIEDGSIDGFYMQAILERRVSCGGSKPPTLVLVKATSTNAIARKHVSKCFTGKRWAYRNCDIDNWLPNTQEEQAAGKVGVYQLQNPQGTTFREMAAAVLKVGSGTSLDLLAKALFEQGHVLTLSAVEQLVDRQEGGEDVGLRTDGYANFAFVEDANGSASVLYVRCFGDGWHAYVRRLGRGGGWGAGGRLLLCNSDASAL